MGKQRKSKINLPQRSTRAAFVPSTIDTDARTVQIVWTTGAEGERCEWDGEVYLESLRVDDKSIRMGRLNSGAPVLDAHQSYELRNQIGVVEKAWIEGGEGHAIVRFADTPEVESTWIKVRDGICRNISVGYVVYHYERVAGQDGAPDQMIAVDWEPLEISFVPVPFDAGAQVRGGVTPRTFTADVTYRTKGKPKMARSVKVIRTAISAARSNLVKFREVADETKIAEAQAELEALSAELDEALDVLDVGTGDDLEGGDGTTQPGAPPANETEEDRKAREAREAEEGTPEERGAKAERMRSAAIREFGNRFKVDTKVTDALVARGLTIEQAKLELLTTLATRQVAINPNAGGTMPDKKIIEVARNMEAAILHRAAPSKHKLPENAREFRGLSMLDMARHSIEMAGGNTRGMDRDAIARMALNVTSFSQQRAAGMHSTSDFPLILGNTINRSLRAAYEAIEQTWMPLGRQANFPDFRERTSVALGEASRLEKVLEGGEYKYGTIPEEGTKIKVTKFGKIIALTWEAIVNDDLNAFDKIPTALANSARETESDLIWNLFLVDRKYSDGVNIFAAGHGNIAGTAGPLNIANLQAARTALRNQKGIDKKTFVRVNPRFLVVGPLNEMAAYQLTSTNYVPVTTGTINPSYNQNLIVIVEPRITDYRWFLVGENVDTFEWGYLDGEGGLTTDTREGFEVDGVEVKARLVFGGDWVDYRGAFSNAGTA
jgi:hypothetical protein